MPTRVSSVNVATSWRCPHCGQHQSGALRCWRCERAADTCSTCHRFRRAVAGGLGYCAGDPTRTPLGGDEVQTCWEAAPVLASVPGLFSELETAPKQPVITTPPVVSTPPRRATKAAKPPLEEPRAAAWAETVVGELTEAPHVEPGSRPTPEVRSRRRRGLRRA